MIVNLLSRPARVSALIGKMFHSEVSANVPTDKGGIAQWQSIRLQIERSPVQLRFPPKRFLYFFKINFFFKFRNPSYTGDKTGKKSKGPTEVLMSSYNWNNFNFFSFSYGVQDEIFIILLFFLFKFFIFCYCHIHRHDIMRNIGRSKGAPGTSARGSKFFHFYAVFGKIPAK